MIPYGSQQLAASFRTVRNNTLEAARDIPEDKYNFSPAAGSRTVEKLLTHIALSYRFQHQIHGVDKVPTLDGFDFPAMMTERAAVEAQPRTKAQVITMLEEGGEVWESFLGGVTEELLSEMIAFSPEIAQPPKSRFEMILSVKEHEMHHRGQLMVIQRMLGIVPHLTRQREERMAAAQETAAREAAAKG